MVKTETVLVGGAALVAAAFALGMGDGESSGNNMTTSAGSSGVSEAVQRVIPTRAYQPPSSNGDVALDTPTGPTQDPSRPPAPDSITGVTGFLDTNYGGESGTVNPDSTNLQNPYLAELYDTDTGE